MEKKKFSKYALIVVPFLVLLVGIGAYFTFFNIPKAETACNKVLDLSKDYLKANGIDTSNMATEEIIGQSIEECAASEENKAQFDGILKTKNYRECILNSETFESVSEC